MGRSRLKREIAFIELSFAAHHSGCSIDRVASWLRLWRCTPCRWSWSGCEARPFCLFCDVRSSGSLEDLSEQYHIFAWGPESPLLLFSDVQNIRIVSSFFLLLFSHLAHHLLVLWLLNLEIVFLQKLVSENLFPYDVPGFPLCRWWILKDKFLVGIYL